MEQQLGGFIDQETSRVGWLKSLEQRDRKHYFKSGFRSQDQAIGAFERGTLNSVGGFTGQGKTSFLFSMAYQMIRQCNTQVYYCNFEMSSASMWNRLACLHDPNLTLIELRQADSITADRVEYFINLSRELAKFSPIFCENPDIKELIKVCTAKIERGSDSVLIIDYFALLTMRGFGSAERWSLQAECAKLLKHLATYLEIPIIVAIQLNPSIEEKKEKIPTLADFRGDKEIVHHSNVVLALKREKRDLLDVYCLKNRNGPLATFSLDFIESRAAVGELD
jgi:replicative DNA helicase